MHIFAKPFWTPKKGNCEDEYEDALWPQECQEYQSGCARFAVADGATESSFAQLWAGLLVQAVGDGRLTPAALCDQIPLVRKEWHQLITAKTLPWYAEAKVRQGAFAALVALELTAEESDSGTPGRWRAAALGDSCLFHVRGEDVLARFPVERPTEFNNRPYLLGTATAENDSWSDHIRNLEGTWVTGDSFYLMTDALACWFLSEVESGHKPWTKFHELQNGNKENLFATWVSSLRDSALIRNDDCTLLSLEIR